MYNKILVPLDGSENAEKILKHVKIVATSCKVPKVILLDVIEPVYFDQSLLNMTGSVMKDIREAGRAISLEYVEKIRHELNQQGINAEGVIEFGRAADVILDFAETNDIDLIMLCTHGRSGVSRWMFGSVAERIIQHATVPVFLLSLRGLKE